MKHTPELIVMLTHNDITVPDAAAVFCPVSAHPRPVLGL